MEMIVEKISLVAPLKNSILDIYTVGQRVQQLVDTCNGSSHNCLSFLQIINYLLMNIDGEETTPEQNLLFHHMCIENKNSFLIYDQINKKFGQEIYTLDNRTLKVAIFFEIEKIKKSLDVLNKVEKLEGNLYVFSKSFL